MNSQPTAATLDPEPALATTQRRFIPGWIMLGMAGMAQFMSAPGQSYSVAVFKDPMLKTLGMTEIQYSAAYSFATIFGACLLPFVGRSLDRFGARIMLPIIGTGLSIACYFMSHVQSITGLYITFSLVRSLGQGALILVSGWLVGEWFERKRGMATALAGIGGGLSVMLVPLWNNWMITSNGWQATWIALAIIVFSSLVIPGIVLVRNRPEDIGLFPDGIDPRLQPDEPEPKATSTKRVKRAIIQPTQESWTVSQVLRDFTFWKILAAPATAALVATGLIFHQISLFESQGMTKDDAVFMIAFQAGIATLLTFPMGWLTDRIASRYLLAIQMIVLAIANALLLNIPHISVAFLYAALIGFQASIFRSTGNVVWINYYGRANQGAVRGVAWSMMIFAAAAGPLPLAISVDYFGTYSYALFGFIALPILAAIAVFSAHPPTLKQPVEANS